MKIKYGAGWLLIWVTGMLFMVQSIAAAADKVIVVPLRGAVGNAAAEDVLSGKTFSNATKRGLSGTMANVGRQDITPTPVQQYITQGYHNGTGTVTGDAELSGENIRKGINIFGVEGEIAVVVCTDVDPNCTAQPDDSCSFNHEACCLKYTGLSCAALLAECAQNTLACTWIGYCDGWGAACRSVGEVLAR